MKIRYGCELAFVAKAPTPTICMIDVHPSRAHELRDGACFNVNPATVAWSGVDSFGNIIRRFEAPAGETRISFLGEVADTGALDARDPGAEAMPIGDLPNDVLTYLNASRYCDSDLLAGDAWRLFGNQHRDTRLVEKICDFAHDRIQFGYHHARPTRTASQAHAERVGVCRDFAHLAIALCRAVNIPARYVNGYMGDIGVPADPAPMDFNAWFEAYLGGRWYTFDARHNCRRIGRIQIAKGRDACDVPIFQTFGPHILTGFKVVTEEVAQDAPQYVMAA
jgi:transglutaminase-like putative cysteine protease